MSDVAPPPPPPFREGGSYAYARSPRGGLQPSTQVRCPICLDLFAWNDSDLFRRQPDGTYSELDLGPTADDRKRANKMLGAWKRCPNPSGDMPRDHYLPVAYARSGSPLVIGLVGRTESGKSHLLASMIMEIERNGLSPLGLTAEPVDIDMHQEFVRSSVAPLARGEVIPQTEPVPAEAQVLFMDALLVGDAQRRRAVAFFDVSGEDLTRNTTSMNFVLAVDALIFVVDAEQAIGRDGGTSHRPVSGDPAFDMVLNRLRGQDGMISTVPAATVIAKSDQWRFEPPVARWVRRPTLTAYRNPGLVPAVSEIEEESRDAYAFLYAHGAAPWLRPFETFRRSTLHFVSATGSGPVEEHARTGTVRIFRRGVRPRRVLDPLAAIFAMTGLLGDEAAKEVGI